MDRTAGSERPADQAPASPAHPTAEERARAVAIVAGLPLAQRILLCSGRDFWTTEEIPGQVPPMMLTDGPHGLRKQLGEGDHIGLTASAPATCFPTATTLGSTWDVDLLEEVGAALGGEARAEGVGVLLGPGLNLKRHPRGGRCFEYLSEDPHLSGVLAAAMVRGIQSQGVAACVKHFAANNQESHRMVVDAIIDERTLHELYLRGFELAVTLGRPAALMTSYNLVNGTYPGESPSLLSALLRAGWGFDGLVVSDWIAVADRVAGLAAGLDLEMPSSSGAFDASVEQAVADGRLDERAVDAAASRVVAAALHAAALHDTPPGPLDHDAQHALARRAAAAGTVLLANDGILPLRPSGTIAVIGAFADEPRYQGAGSSLVNPTRLDALRPALAEALAGRATLRHAAGYDPRTGATTPALIAQAAAAARESDVAVLVVGLPARLESEGIDRADCRLPEDLDALIALVLDANPRTVVVLVNGGVVELPWADRAPAIVEAWLGGQAGGSALADVLLGIVEPGGRLAESIPVEVSALPASANFPGRPRQVEYRERHLVGYRFHDTGTPARFPFGHGLGYTTFDLGQVQVEGAGTTWTVRVPVHNTGARSGAVVVQVYVRPERASVARPDKELRGFAKLHLVAGGRAQAEIRLDRRAFAVWDVAARDWLVEAGGYEVLVGTSSTAIHATVPVAIPSEDVVAAEPAVAGAVATDAEWAALLRRPIPTPRPARPFTPSTTPAELDATRAGRALHRLMLAAARRRVDLSEFGDAAAMADAVISSMPLRTFVQMSGGVLSFAALDRVLALLNADVGELLRWGSARRGQAPR